MQHNPTNREMHPLSPFAIRHNPSNPPFRAKPHSQRISIAYPGKLRFNAVNLFPRAPILWHLVNPELHLRNTWYLLIAGQ